MGAVTYPNEKVAKFVALNFVPVKIETSNTAVMQRFLVSWTPPCWCWTRRGGSTTGAWGFSPEDLIPTLMTAKGRWALEILTSLPRPAPFEEVISCHPDMETAAEALFSWGSPNVRSATTPKFCGKPTTS